MGSLMKSSWTVIQPTLGKFLYMEISAAIVEIPISFNFVKNIHGTVTKIVSVPMCSRSVIKINTIRQI